MSQPKLTLFACGKKREPEKTEPKYKCFHCGQKVVGLSAYQEHTAKCTGRPS